MKIILSPYNPIWKQLFEQEKELLSTTLSGTDFTIEHIGSTSIENLDAKPVIDIMIGLTDFSKANDQVKKIVPAGYQYIDRYEDTMPYRRFFIKDQDGIRTHHIHMVQTGTEFWQRHLAFRDYLRQHPEEKLRYQELKQKLSQQEWNDVNDYANAKTAFIREIEQKALRGQ